ncbi:MAG: LptA/OstA family protein [Candidatus Gastranaerophilales bacterium]
MKKLILILVLLLFSGAVVVQASDLVIESKTQTYNENENKLKFEGDVKVSVDDIKVYSDKADVSMKKNRKLDTATFYEKPYAVEVQINKKREVKANILKLSLITKVVKAQGDTQTTVFDGKTPVVVINADEQEYDTKTGVMIAQGNVTILYKDIETYSNYAKIVSEKDGEIKTMDLVGNARLMQDGNESFADRFEYNAKTQAMVGIGNTTSNMIMESGEKLILKANRQEYTQDKNVFNASGNCHVWYGNYYAVGPKIVVYPNSEGKPNEVYFVGRSSITEAFRTIYADKIKMILNPKDFQAEGNTRTVIQNVGSSDDSSEESGMTLGF